MSDLRRAAILIKTASCAYMRYDSNAACVHVCAQPAANVPLNPSEGQRKNYYCALFYKR